MTDQPRDWRMLPYFQDPRNMQKFRDADIVWACAGDWRRCVYGGQLPEVAPGQVYSRVKAEVEVPIARERGELRLLLGACVALKGRHDYNERHEEEHL